MIIIMIGERTVEKFGGTTMAQPEVPADIVEELDQTCIVVSAPGKSPGVDIKTTDTLDAMSTHIIEGTIAQARSLRDENIDRFDELYDMLGSKERKHLRDRASLIISGENPDRSYVTTRGELVSALYFAALIGAEVVENPPIVFNRDGTVNIEATIRQSQRAMMDTRAHRVVFPGFFGYDDQGRAHTLGRGGSDRTPAFIARALGWDYRNWTDVNGIASADPRIVGIDNVRWRKKISRDEVREGANHGSGVLQGGTIVDLADSDVIVQVLNSFDINAPGTFVVKSSDLDDDHPEIVSVTGRSGLVDIFIDEKGMAETRGFIAHVTGLLDTIGFSIDYMPMSHDTAHIVGSFEGDSGRISSVLDGISHTVRSGVALAAIVGESLKDLGVSMHRQRDFLDILIENGIKAQVMPSEGAASITSIISDADKQTMERLTRTLNERFILAA